MLESLEFQNIAHENNKQMEIINKESYLKNELNRMVKENTSLRVNKNLFLIILLKI